MKVLDQLLIKKKAIIETINDKLKDIAQVEHSRHRSCHTLGALTAYSLKKPTINVGTTVDRQLTLF